jgi:CheY-like chemotaxis protein
VADVLVADPDSRSAVHLEVQLRALGHEVRVQRSLEGALLATIERRPSVLLVAARLGGRTGAELIALLDRGVGRPAVTCLLSDDPPEVVARVTAELGVAWLPIPVDPVGLARVVGERARGPRRG